VALGADVAVRISLSDALAEESLRAQRLVDALPPLPFAVPMSAWPLVRIDGMMAAFQRRVHGQEHASGSGDPAAIVNMLDAHVPPSWSASECSVTARSADEAGCALQPR
jgi:hypothetical protein